MPGGAKLTILAAVAYEMMLRQVTALPGREAFIILDPLLHRLNQSITGYAFLSEITARSGLLIEYSPEQYSFAHHTFQEYLAARHIAANLRIEKTLATSVDDPWWHEVIILWAAHSRADIVIEACLASGSEQALRLAAECAEVGDLSAELRSRVAVQLSGEIGQ